MSQKLTCLNINSCQNNILTAASPVVTCVYCSGVWSTTHIIYLYIYIGNKNKTLYIFYYYYIFLSNWESLRNTRELSLSDVTELNGQNAFFLFLCCIEAGDFLIPETACMYCVQRKHCCWLAHTYIVHLKMLLWKRSCEIKLYTADQLKSSFITYKTALFTFCQLVAVW